MRILSTLLLVLLAALAPGACGGGGERLAPCTGCQAPGADLSGFTVERITAGGIPIEAWIAETAEQRAQGLMNASPAQLAPLGDGTPRGMLFVIDPARPVSFWMKDTYVALDLAYADAGGIIRSVHALEPLDETSVPSEHIVGYALEVPASTLGVHGIGIGSAITRAP